MLIDLPLATSEALFIAAWTAIHASITAGLGLTRPPEIKAGKEGRERQRESGRKRNIESEGERERERERARQEKKKSYRVG